MREINQTADSLSLPGTTKIIHNGGIRSVSRELLDILGTTVQHTIGGDERQLFA